MKDGKAYGQSPSGLSGLIDTDISSPTAGQIIQRNANNDAWVNANLPTVDSTLNTSSDNAIANSAVATALATRGGIVDFGLTTVKTISSTDVDIISTTVNLNAGKYAFFVGLNVSINTGSYQFLLALSIDNTTNVGLCSNANPTGNSTLLGACEFTISTSGNHTLKLYGHTANASKTVTVAGANSVRGILVRIS